MFTKISIKQSFSLLGSSISSLFKNPYILYPFAILVFVQLLFLEILFFAPRFPLSLVFHPIIRRLKGDVYLHYPFNFDLVSHWFQSAQIFIFLFITSFFIGKAVMFIAKINQEGRIEKKVLPKLSLRSYVNLIVGFFLIFLAMYGLTSLYGLLIRRAAQIRSMDGIYFLIKQAVLVGAPYFNLLFSIIVTTIFAYLVPIIVLEKKNIFIALGRNFKILRGSFFPLLIVIFISSLLYIPILLIRFNQRWLLSFVSPEGWQVFIIFGVFVMLFIDAIQYTAITTCYLLTKDE